MRLGEPKVLAKSSVQQGHNCLQRALMRSSSFAWRQFTANLRGNVFSHGTTSIVIRLQHESRAIYKCQYYTRDASISISDSQGDRAHCGSHVDDPLPYPSDKHPANQDQGV